jgi:hypothetical protein
MGPEKGPVFRALQFREFELERKNRFEFSPDETIAIVFTPAVLTRDEQTVNLV